MKEIVVCTYCNKEAEHGMHYISGRIVQSTFCCEEHYRKLKGASDEFFRDELQCMRKKDRINENREMQGVQES